MKRAIYTVFIVLLAVSQGAAQGLTGLVSAGPSQAEVANGIKAALEVGIEAGTQRLGLKDGFLLNPSVKILFPPEAVKAESTLRGLGMNQLCDNFIVTLNGAAETAVKEAKPIFVQAIKEMSVEDATAILLSKADNAGTRYFKDQTSQRLQDRFKPVIQASLDKAGATKHWTNIVTTYNKIPLVKKMNTDLAAYATSKAIDGLFIEVSREELKIRKNAQARTSPLLQKVFGFAENKK